jgi:hypothetical protein
MRRPIGVAALSVFFAVGAMTSFTAAVALLTPGGFLEPIWRSNPTARDGFSGLGGWAVMLMASVSGACALSAVGLWRGLRWGHRVALALLAVNLVAGKATRGRDLRAAIGLPVCGAFLAYLLTRKVRQFFESTGRTSRGA